MIRSILDASELMIINDISGYPDHEQIPDPAVENCFRDHPRIRAGDDDRKGLLSVLRRFKPHSLGNVANFRA
jgi:hypothetical protein